MAISDLNLTNTAAGVRLPGGMDNAKPFSLDESGRLPVDPSTLPKQELRFTVTELGQQLKQEMPDLFGNYSDDEVGQKLLERKPELKAYIIQPEEKSGFFSNLLKGIAKPFAKIGVTALTPFSSGTETRQDVSAEGFDAQGNWVGTQRKSGAVLPWLGNIKPIGTDIAQGKVGAGVRDILGTGLELGAFGIGGPALGAAAPLKSKVLAGLATGSGIGGTSGLGIGLQDENATVGSVLGSAALGAGVGSALGMAFPLAEAGISKTKGAVKNIWQRFAPAQNEALPSNVDVATGNPLQRLGKKIQTTVIRPTAKDINNGFKIDNVAKYDLGGNLPTAYNKTIQRLNEFTGRLDDLIRSGGDEGVVNLGDLVDELRRRFSSGGLTQLGNKKTILRTIENIESELDLIKPNWRIDPLSLLDGIQTKRQVGQFTAFLHDPLKKGTSAEEDVWNALYMLLKEETEKQSEKMGISGLREVNAAISDIIPIQQAIIRRIPVSERNNIIGLSDLIGGTGMFISPGAIAVPLAQRLFKSGTFADYLMKLGSAEGASKALPAVKSAVLQSSKAVAPKIKINPNTIIKAAVPGILKTKQGD